MDFSSSNAYGIGALIVCVTGLIIIGVNAFCVAWKTRRGNRPANKIDWDKGE